MTRARKVMAAPGAVAFAIVSLVGLVWFALNLPYDVSPSRSGKW